MIEPEYMYYREFWEAVDGHFGRFYKAAPWLLERVPSETELTLRLKRTRTLARTRPLRVRPEKWTWFWPPLEYPGHPEDLRVLLGMQKQAEPPTFPDRKVAVTDWRDVMRAAQAEADRRALGEPSQQTATADFSNATLPVAFMLLSDIHFGSPQCDYATFMRHVDYLSRYPNLYGIVLGDVCEWAISQKMLDATLGQVFPPSTQARLVRAVIDEMSQKLAAVVLGNHEGRAEKYGGFDVGEYMYDRLTEGGAPYLKDGGTLRMTVGNTTYTALLMHGDGIPGNSMYSRTAKHQRLQLHQHGWHDVCAMGHTHQAEITIQEVAKPDGTGRRIVHELQAGSYKVRHHEQYPHRLGFKGSPTVAMPTFVLYPNGHRILSFYTVEDALPLLEAHLASQAA